MGDFSKQQLDSENLLTELYRLEKENTHLKNQVHGLQLELSQLKALVRTDALTGLYNHRYFREALHREIERTGRTSADFCLVFIDLDHFKSVNDNWGHEVGNRALKHFADIIRTAIRPMDLPCRYGGEEFALLLPATTLKISEQIAERIRIALEQTPLPVNDGSLVITASFGVSCYTADCGLTQDELIAEADQQLYRAKNQGRNQVCVTDIKTKEHSQVSADEKDLLNALFQQNSSENKRRK